MVNSGLNSSSTELTRGLGLFGAITLVIGSMIGSGVFVSTAEAYDQVFHSPLLALFSWVIGAGITLMGALCFAELGCMYSKAGGEYEYLKNGLGRFWAFLFIWTQITVYATGSIAIMAFTSASYLMRLVFPLATDLTWQSSIAASVIVAILTLVNCFGVVFVSKVQNALTVVKVLGILSILALGIYAFGKLDFSYLTSLGDLNQGFTYGEDFKTWQFVFGFGSATVACLWAYDGWNNLSRVTEETQHVNRNLPLALLVSIGVVALIYFLMNALYFVALTPAQLSSSKEIAITTAQILTQDDPILSKLGIPFGIGFLIFLSSFGAVNGSVLSGARLFFAPARDGLFLKFFAQVSPKTHTPIAALILQGAISIALIMIGRDFAKLLNYFSFSAWLFYGLCAAVLICLRFSKPDQDRPFKVPGYPFTPIFFLIAALFLIVSQVVNFPGESLLALFVILLGIIPYQFFRKKSIDDSACRSVTEKDKTTTSSIERVVVSEC
ncbi:MAG: amino acid permease [Candidatus Caenarcaniphilales bacterium]|nr:amino acid permease [Candidatus Caenarcaniphilales bacterium]